MIGGTGMVDLLVTAASGLGLFVLVMLLLGMMNEVDDDELR